MRNPSFAALTFGFGNSTLPRLLLELITTETVSRVGDTEVLLLVVAAVGSTSVDVGPVRVAGPGYSAVNVTANVRLVGRRGSLCFYGRLVESLEQTFTSAVNLGIPWKHYADQSSAAVGGEALKKVWRTSTRLVALRVGHQRRIVVECGGTHALVAKAL